MAHSATLLLTRPRVASEHFAIQVMDKLGALQIEISPLIEIEFTDLAQEPSDETVVFTSRNGVEAWAHAGFSTSAHCFCVGEATANAARDLGFDPHVSGGTVEHLVKDVQSAAPQGQILHVHGRHTRGDLAARLCASGQRARGIVAYEQKLLDLSATALAMLQGGAPVIVPLFSPRSAAHFAGYGPFGPQVKMIAISKTAASACPKALIAPHPTANGMLAAISQVLNA